jgi:predicted ABC-type ATPase
VKILYIVAGANGSGKTTFAKSFSTINNLYFINADEIAKELDQHDITKYKVKAGKIFFEEFHKRLNLNQSFVVETTLSGKYLIKYIQKAKALNFYISLIYLFLENPQTNILRVENRVRNGGHYVPTEDIVRRFYRSKHMFKTVYKNIVDDWSVYYNSNEIFESVADKNQIFDDEKYKQFLKDTDASDNN